MYLTAVSQAELLYGVAIMPAGKRRNALQAAMTRWLDLGFVERILPFDSTAARAGPAPMSIPWAQSHLAPRQSVSLRSQKSNSFVFGAQRPSFLCQ